MSCNEAGDNGHDVVGKLLSDVPGVFAVRLVTVNHDFCVKLAEEPLDQLISVSTKAVFVLNDNCSDSPLVYLLQKGDKSFASEVETGPDVLDDGVARVGFLQDVDLAREVFGLTAGGDASVADAAADGDVGLACFFLSVWAVRFLTAEGLLDVALGVEALTARHAAAGDASLIGPFDEGGVGDGVGFADTGCRNERIKGWEGFERCRSSVDDERGTGMRRGRSHAKTG